MGGRFLFFWCLRTMLEVHMIWRTETEYYIRWWVFPWVTLNGERVGGSGGGCHDGVVVADTVERQRRQIFWGFDWGSSVFHMPSARVIAFLAAIL